MELFRKLTWLMRRRTKEADLEEELRAHLAEDTEELVDAGMTTEEAQRAARLDLGNITLVQEDTRAAWTWTVLDQLLRDLRSALRMLVRDVRVNLVILFTLALSLSANTIVFSVVNRALLRSFPFPDIDGLVLIRETKLPEFTEFSVAPGTFLEWKKRSTTFESVGAVVTKAFTLIEEGKPESVSGVVATPSLLPTLRLKPELGRAFSEGEGQQGNSDVVIIGHRLWSRRFASDPGVIGRTINIDSQPRVVIGVMPAGVDFFDLLVPMVFSAGDRVNHGGRDLTVFGRLKVKTAIEDASKEFKQIARQLEMANPASKAGWSVLLTPMGEAFGDEQTALVLLWCVVGFVLLIACANIANLLLARSISRRRDIALRLALGATRLQIVRHLLVESIALALVGGAVGVVLGYSGFRALAAVAGDALPPGVSFDSTVLAFTALLSLITGVLFGLLPALDLSKTDLNESLKDGARSLVAGRGRQRVRGALVVAEVAVSLVLLIGAGLAIRSFVKLSRVNPGFDARNVLVAELSLPARKYPGPDDMRRFTDNALRELSAMPGVMAVGASQILPITAGQTHGVLFEGRPPLKPSEIPAISYLAVSPDYFDVIGIPLKRGRAFGLEDRAGSALVTIVSESFVTRFFPNENPIGKRIRVTRGPEGWREIVGIVGNTKQYGLDVTTSEQVYEPLAQAPFPSMAFVLKTTAKPMSQARQIETRIQIVDKEQPLSMVRPLEAVVAESTEDSRTIMVAMILVAGISLLIAITGLYGVMAYSVSQRTCEIGVRMALGAERGSVLRLVIRQGMVRTAIGLVLGLAGAFALTRVMRAALFETSATDLVTFVGVSLILVCVALLACYIPARRASRVDPAVALRHE